MNNQDYPFKFSIITAVYNTEAYLEDAVNSILSQDIGFTDSVQLILVDDGSSDQSGNICDTYQKQYPSNIKVIHKPNGGVSSARNEGLRYAEGRYINFLDSDDRLSSNTLSAVYDFFTEIDNKADFISVPMYFFEKKEGPHRLNYKFKSGENKVINVNKKYNYVQMAVNSAFFKKEVFDNRSFDTSLHYSEDAKMIMDILLDNPHYGIVPDASYYYRVRTSTDSARDACWSRKEWYLDPLEHYVHWSIEEARKRRGHVPRFVQFTLMYDVQGFFRMKKLPADILSPEELEKFLSELQNLLDELHPSVIIEQKNMSMEQKDNVLRMKKSSGKGSLIYDDEHEDAYIQYKTISSHPMSAYKASVTHIVPVQKGVLIEGTVKTCTHFPDPSQVLIRLTCSRTIRNIPCDFHRNPDGIFVYADKILAQVWDFQVVIPYFYLKEPVFVDLCLNCDLHTIRYKKTDTRDVVLDNCNSQDSPVIFQQEDDHFSLYGNTYYGGNMNDNLPNEYKPVLTTALVGEPLMLNSVSVEGTSLKLIFNPEELPAVAPEHIRIFARRVNSDIEIPLTSTWRSSTELLADVLPVYQPEVFDRAAFRIYLVECSPEQNVSRVLKTAERPERQIISEGTWYQKENSPESFEYVLFLQQGSRSKVTIMEAQRYFYINRTQDCHLKHLSMKNGILKVTFMLEPGEYEYQKTYTQFRHVLLADAQTYDFETLEIKEKGQELKITVSLDMNAIDWKSIYWDIHVRLRHKVTGQETRCSIKMGKYTRMFHKFLYNGSFPGKDGFFLYPFYTGEKALALVYREKGKYDDMDIVFKELAAIALFKLTKPYWKHKHICLVCEKYSAQAQESGYCFFKHCMEQDEEKNLGKQIYYIIDKDSPDRAKLAPYSKRVVDFMSIRHMIYTQAAELFVSSDSRYHSYAFKSRHSVFNRYLKKFPTVFLQHGVISFKCVPSFAKGRKLSCDLFVVSTEKERQIVIDYLNYSPEQVINTGLPRWDVLEDKSQDKREILIMPTWRYSMEIISDNDFEKSEYFLKYTSLLNSPRLAQILEDNDLQVNFYLHPKFQNHMGTFQSSNNRIHLLSFGDVPVNEMLMRCRMLITDYSSVAWDVFYQDKPVLFYQFDLDTYEQAEGSYIDMRKELFGDRTEDENELLDLFEKNIKNGFKVEPKYEEMRHEYFKEIDQNHSKRVCDCIKEYFKEPEEQAEIEV